jgi:hypothetical protein
MKKTANRWLAVGALLVGAGFSGLNVLAQVCHLKDKCQSD